jgi:hypothetical protein
MMATRTVRASQLRVGDVLTDGAELLDVWPDLFFGQVWIETASTIGYVDADRRFRIIREPADD